MNSTNCRIKVPALAMLKRFGPALKVASWTARSSFLLHLDPPVRPPTTVKLFTDPPFYPILVYVSLTAWCDIQKTRKTGRGRPPNRRVHRTSDSKCWNTRPPGGFRSRIPSRKRKRLQPSSALGHFFQVSSFKFFPFLFWRVVCFEVL